MEKGGLVVDLNMRNGERDKTIWLFLLSTRREILGRAILKNEDSENSPQRGMFVKSKGN